MNTYLFIYLILILVFIIIIASYKTTSIEGFTADLDYMKVQVTVLEHILNLNTIDITAFVHPNFYQYLYDITSDFNLFNLSRYNANVDSKISDLTEEINKNKNIYDLLNFYNIDVKNNTDLKDFISSNYLYLSAPQDFKDTKVLNKLLLISILENETALPSGSPNFDVDLDITNFIKVKSLLTTNFNYTEYNNLQKLLFDCNINNINKNLELDRPFDKIIYRNCEEFLKEICKIMDTRTDTSYTVKYPDSGDYYENYLTYLIKSNTILSNFDLFGDGDGGTGKPFNIDISKMCLFLRADFVYNIGMNYYDTTKYDVKYSSDDSYSELYNLISDLRDDIKATDDKYMLKTSYIPPICPSYGYPYNNEGSNNNMRTNSVSNQGKVPDKTGGPLNNNKGSGFNLFTYNDNSEKTDNSYKPDNSYKADNSNKQQEINQYPNQYPYQYENQVGNILKDKQLGGQEMGVQEMYESQQGMSQQGMSQQGMSQQGMSQQGMSQQGMSQQGMSQQGMSQQGMSQQGMSQQGMSQQGMPQVSQLGNEPYLRSKMDGLQGRLDKYNDELNYYNNADKVPPCPPCERCPEPSFDCKKVPNYRSSSIDDYMPKPILNDFSNF
jgi:hypothetical protein